MQSSEASQDSVGVIERPSLRAAAALNPIRQGAAATDGAHPVAASTPQQQQQPKKEMDVSDSDSEVGIPTSNGFAAQGGGGVGSVPSRLLSASLPPMAPPTMSSLPRHPMEASSSHDDHLLAGNVNAMSHSSQFYNSQSQSHIAGHLGGINSNSGSFRNTATANNNTQVATPSSHGLVGVLGSDNGSGVYSQTPTMTRFRVDPSLNHTNHHQQQQQPPAFNSNHVLSPSPPSSRGGGVATGSNNNSNNNNNFTTVMIGSGGANTGGGSGTFSGRGAGALPSYSYAGTVGGSDNLSHSNGSGFQTASHNGGSGHSQLTPFPSTNIAGGSSGNYVHIPGTGVPLHPMPNQHPSTTSGASYASDNNNVGSQSFTGSVDAAAGSHGHGALSRIPNPQQQHHQHQHLSYVPSMANTGQQQQFHSPLVSVGGQTIIGHQMAEAGSFVVSSKNNNRSGSFDGVRVGVGATPILANNAFTQQSSTSNRYTTTHNTSSSPNAPTTVNNHTTTTSGFMTTTPSDLMMTSNTHNNLMNSSSPLMAMFNTNNNTNSVQHHHHHNQQQQHFHMSSSQPFSEPLTLISPANAVTNSSCLSGDVPMSGGAIPTYETTGRPMDAFEMAMLREQYLHGAFHVPVDPNDMAGKKKRRRRKRRKDVNEGDMSGGSEDEHNNNNNNDDAPATVGGVGDDGSQKNTSTSAATPAAPKAEIKSKSRVLIVPGVPVHLPLVGKVGFIPYTTILRQYASLQAKKTQSGGGAVPTSTDPNTKGTTTTAAADGTTKPDFVNDTANAVDAAIKSAEAADIDVVDQSINELSNRSKPATDNDDAANGDDDAAPPPSYTDVLIDDDGDKAGKKEEATTATAQVRLFVGQVPYSIELDLMKAIFFVIGGGCDVDHVERIVKWKNRELPSGCLHVHINVEYKLSDHPEGSNTDPTEASSLVHHALKLDQVALLDDEGIWVPTSNRRAFSIVDTHVEAFEAFLSRQNDLDSAAAAAAAVPASSKSQCSESATPSPAVSQDLSQYGPPKPRTMGTFGLTFDEFKGFLRGCAKEVRNTMPDYAVTWSEEDERLGHVDTNTTSHLPPVPVIHPDIAAITMHGRAGGAHAKPPAPPASQNLHPNHQDQPLLHNQNGGAETATTNTTTTTTTAVSGAVDNPCEAVAKGLLCLPVAGFGGTLPHTRPLTFSHTTNNTTTNAANNRDDNSCQSTDTSNCGGDASGGAKQETGNTHAPTSMMIVRPPKGPEDPEFVVPSLSDQREALVAYVSYLKDMNSMLCRPIDRPYQLMSVQRARSTFLPQKNNNNNAAGGANHTNANHSGATSTKNPGGNNSHQSANTKNTMAAAQQRLHNHTNSNGGGFVPPSGYHITAHHQQQQQMFPNQHYDPYSMQHQQQQQQALMYNQHQQQFHPQHQQQYGFVNHQGSNSFNPQMQQQQHHHQQIQQSQSNTNMYGVYQQAGGQHQHQQHAAFHNNNTNGSNSMLYQQQYQASQSQYVPNNNNGYAPVYQQQQQQQQQQPIYWKQ